MGTMFSTQLTPLPEEFILKGEVFWQPVFKDTCTELFILKVCPDSGFKFPEQKNYYTFYTEVASGISNLCKIGEKQHLENLTPDDIYLLFVKSKSLQFHPSKLDVFSSFVVQGD